MVDETYSMPETKALFSKVELEFSIQHQHNRHQHNKEYESYFKVNTFQFVLKPVYSVNSDVIMHSYVTDILNSRDVDIRISLIDITIHVIPLLLRFGALTLTIALFRLLAVLACISSYKIDAHIYWSPNACQPLEAEISTSYPCSTIPCYKATLLPDRNPLSNTLFN